ncbi:MAG: hypothetical protein ACM3O3_12600 [Syntrophothermus sp.]
MIKVENEHVLNLFKQITDGNTEVILKLKHLTEVKKTIWEYVYETYSELDKSKVYRFNVRTNMIEEVNKESIKLEDEDTKEVYKYLSLFKSEYIGIIRLTNEIKEKQDALINKIVEKYNLDKDSVYKIERGLITKLELNKESEVLSNV